MVTKHWVERRDPFAHSPANSDGCRGAPDARPPDSQSSIGAAPFPMLRAVPAPLVGPMVWRPIGRDSLGRDPRVIILQLREPWHRYFRAAIRGPLAKTPPDIQRQHLFSGSVAPRLSVRSSFGVNAAGFHFPTNCLRPGFRFRVTPPPTALPSSTKPRMMARLATVFRPERPGQKFPPRRGERPSCRSVSEATATTPHVRPVLRRGSRSISFGSRTKLGSSVTPVLTLLTAAVVFILLIALRKCCPTFCLARPRREEHGRNRGYVAVDLAPAGALLNSPKVLTEATSTFSGFARPARGDACSPRSGRGYAVSRLGRKSGQDRILGSAQKNKKKRQHVFLFPSRLGRESD